MSEENKALVRRLVDEAINGGRLELVEDCSPRSWQSRLGRRSGASAPPSPTGGRRSSTWSPRATRWRRGFAVPAPSRASSWCCPQQAAAGGRGDLLPARAGGSLRGVLGTGGQRDAAAAAGRGLLAAPVRGRADRRRQHPRRPCGTTLGGNQGSSGCRRRRRGPALLVGNTAASASAILPAQRAFLRIASAPFHHWNGASRLRSPQVV